jgi:hypothetical protein
MTTGRRCRACGQPSLHRKHRQPWQRALAWVLPLRPLHCIDCGTSTWAPLPLNEARPQWSVAALLWLLLLAALLRSTAAPAPDGTTRAAPSAKAAATATPTAVPAKLASHEHAPGAILSTATPPSAAPAPVDVGRRRMHLQAVEARWIGEAMEVVLQTGGGALHPRLSANAGVGGYVLDLPGDWRMAADLPTTQNFEHSNLQRLRFGRHRDYLRIVFSLREPAAGAPELDEGDGRLRVLVR